MIPPLVEGCVGLLLIFLFVTQIIMPLFAGLPLFWIFSVRGRAIVDATFREYMKKQNKQ